MAIITQVNIDDLAPEMPFPEIFHLCHKYICKPIGLCAITRANEEFENQDEHFVRRSIQVNLIQIPLTLILQFADIPYEPYGNAISGRQPYIPEQAACVEERIVLDFEKHLVDVTYDW